MSPLPTVLPLPPPLFLPRALTSLGVLARGAPEKERGCFLEEFSKRVRERENGGRVTSPRGEPGRGEVLGREAERKPNYAPAQVPPLCPE